VGRCISLTCAREHGFLLGTRLELCGLGANIIGPYGKAILKACCLLDAAPYPHVVALPCLSRAGAQLAFSLITVLGHGRAVMAEAYSAMRNPTVTQVNEIQDHGSKPRACAQPKVAAISFIEFPLGRNKGEQLDRKRPRLG
jgi:hypothetical protein